MSKQELVPNSHPADFLGHLSQLMREPSFRKFHQEYFSTWSDSKASLMLIKTYFLIESELSRQGFIANEDEIIEVIRRLMKHRECRRYLVDSMVSFINDDQDFSRNFAQLINQETTKILRIEGSP